MFDYAQRANKGFKTRTVLAFRNAATTVSWLAIYSTGHLLILIIRNTKTGPGWISYLRMGAVCTSFNI